MKIVKQYAWSRRDFNFDSECESCGHIETDQPGYDDSYFLNTIMPDLKCPSCDKSSNDIRGSQPALTPRYNPNITM